MKYQQKSFLLRLLFFAIFIFAIHIAFLKYFKKELFEAYIIEAYITNLLLAITVYFFLYRFRERFKNQLGFLFLAGSVIKFALFFLFFYGKYKEDGKIFPQEFFAFFIPYATTLIIEVFSLSKWMNKLES